MTDTDKAVADYLAMTNDLLIAMATQLETLRKGIGVLQAAQGVMADAPQQQHAIPQAAPQHFAPIGWKCPEHGTSRTVPAGVSQRTGQAYDAFVACGEFGCKQKPPRVQPAAPARAMPPSQMP
jgi:hypothetical protein